MRALARPGPWKRGPVLAALAVVLGLVMAGHAAITDFGGLGSLVETFLPWFGLGVPVLLAGALLRRSATAVVALVVPVTVWLTLFGGLLTDKTGGETGAKTGASAGSSAAGRLVMVSHNVNADNPDPAGTARDLAASGADLLALEELTPEATDAYESALAASYPYHAVRGTVGLWSRLPLSETRPIEMERDAGPLGDAKPAEAKLAQNRALRTTVATERGPLAVYVAHLGSVRALPRTGFWTESRDAGAAALSTAVAAERNGRVVVLGDFNGTMDDRAFDGLTARLSSVQETAGDGFGFTWPTAFPVARIDQILVRGVEPESSWTLPATESDHLPVAARVRW
ncbi:endonuclease/exonuclease/phosphatase family protein [Streptomyces sp. NPDC093085]|uniref:endonuclease/exonuclease/phosphatase family protein n=1 Tax=Streptomyces sp. NPDC093085 TaxID=3155068 RepID=UPI003412911E